VLQIRLLAEVDAGQSQKALDDLKLSLRLIDSTRDHPYLISHLVRMAMVFIVIQPIYEGIAQHRWDDAQLADLEATLATRDLLADFRTAMRGERACGLATLETWRVTREQRSYFGEEPVTNSLRWTPNAFFYQSELAIAQTYDRFILPMTDLTNRTVSLACYRAGEQYTHEATNHYSPYTALAKMTFPAVSRTIMRFALVQTSVDLARVACTLERYRLAHGAYPETLDSLGPEMIQPLPHDIINGQPLHYRRTGGGGYLLYSVGWNETDDGGTVIETKNGGIDLEKGDWVWQLPPKS
jgi:hypothetical protein